jgi:hypothetical protein
VGYDQFHQSESMIYFYLLCMADPTHPVNAERATRFAGLFLNEVLKKENWGGGGTSYRSISIYLAIAISISISTSISISISDHLAKRGLGQTYVKVRKLKNYPFSSGSGASATTEL